MSDQNEFFNAFISNIFLENNIDIDEGELDSLGKSIQTYSENGYDKIYPELDKYDFMEEKEINIGIIAYNFETIDSYFSDINGNEGVIESANIYIFQLFNTIEEKVKQTSKEKITQLRRKVQNAIKNQGYSISLPRIKFNSFVIQNKSLQPKSAKIRIFDRVRSLDERVDLESTRDSDEHLFMNGYAYVANLYDIVSELYGTLGSELFQSNLRFGISDQMNVETSIAKTLSEKPELFWFYNNGISLYVNDSNQIKKHKPNEIQLDFKEENKPSVINGAQTITASGNYFFSDINVCNKERTKNEAKVILRIFTFESEYRKWKEYKEEHPSIESTQEDNKNSNEPEYIQNNWMNAELKEPMEYENINDYLRRAELSKQKLNEITVALNRQKPIKAEDIAYTTQFVTTVNGDNDLFNQFSSGFSFSIARRGEPASIMEHTYELVKFARIVKATVALDPGSARTNGAATLLKVKDTSTTEGGVEFNRTEIFRDEKNMNSDIDEEGQKEFIKNYNIVNFAFDLSQYLNKKFLDTNNQTDEINESLNSEFQGTNIEDINTTIDRVKLYGRYHILALIIISILYDEATSIESVFVSSKSRENDIIEFSEIDFTNWKYEKVQNEDEINERIDDAIFELAKTILSNEDIDSNTNDFKKSEQFERTLERVYKLKKVL